MCLHSHKDIEICGDYSDVELYQCVFAWNDQNSTTYDGCREFLKPELTKIEVINANYTKFCYFYETNDTLFYGNDEAQPPLKGSWVKGIDFYFKILNVTNVISHFLSVG